MISIICVYNNEKILDECLKASLKLQRDVLYETVFVDSREKKFFSAAEALNYGGSQAKGDYLIFLHQDIVLAHDTLHKIYEYCKDTDFGIMGVAGVKEINGVVMDYSKIVHGMNKKLAATNHDFKNLLEVDTLDECMLIIPKNIFDSHEFAEYYDTWHLYGVEYCLKMKKIKQKIYVAPVYLWHKSNGVSLNLNYFDAIRKLAQIYRKDVKKIVTFFGIWPTNNILINIKCFYRKMRFKVKGI